MAVLALAVAGAAIGSTVGMAGVGWAVGSALGMMLFSHKSSSSANDQQQLMDLRITSTEYGDPIPYVRGAALVNGQVWWNSDRRPRTVTTNSTTASSKGKGGGKDAGGGDQTFTVYDCDVLFGLTDNQIIGVRRIFDNGKLIWTSDAAATIGSLEASAVTDAWTRVTVYTGADDQLPDPVYEAAIGTDEACAYRGRGSVFIEGLQLGTSGQFRNLAFEVVVDGSSGIGSTRVEYEGLSAPVGGSSVREIAVLDPNRNYVWTVTETVLGANVEVYVTDDTAQALLVHITTPLLNNTAVSIEYVPQTGSMLHNEVWVAAEVFVGHHYILRYNADASPPTFTDATDIGSFGTAEISRIIYNPTDRKIFRMCQNGLYYADEAVASHVVGDLNLIPGVSGARFVGDLVLTTDYIAVFLYGGLAECYLLRRSDYSVYLHIPLPYAGLPYFQVAYDSSREKLITFEFSGLDYTVIDIATGSVTLHTLALPAVFDTDPYPSEDMVGVIYHADKYLFVATNSTSIPHPDIGSTIWTVNPDTFVVETVYTYERYAAGIPIVIPTILAPSSRSAYILVFDGTYIKRYYIGGTLVTLECPSVQEVVSDLMVRAGLATSKFDVTDLSSITRRVCSFAIAQITATRNPLEMLMTVFSFEVLMSGLKLTFRVRGGAVVATIPYAELGAGKSIEERVEPIALHHNNDLEIPAQVALSYVNIDNDYQTDVQPSDRLVSATNNTVAAATIAMGMHPAEAKGVADVILLDQAASAVTTKIALLPDYIHLEPADPITVYDKQGSSFRFRITRKTDAFPLVQFECVLDEPSVLISEGITDTDYESSTVVVAPSATLMELMDIPILEDADSNNGFYVAAKGAVADTWNGASILNSPDGVEYITRLVVTSASILGDCATTLGDWTGPRVMDELNSVTVNVGEGVLSSSTRAAILDNGGTNLILIGSEILQFVTATLIGDGIYTLTSLLRGCRGTEWAMVDHVADERAVLMSGSVRRIIPSTSELGLSRYYKGVTLGRRLTTATAEAFTDNAVGLKPFSPFDLRATRDGSNNITFTWQRRTRLATRVSGVLGVSVPLGEASERYILDVYADGTYATVLRTISGMTSPTASYTAALQTADGLTPGDPVYVIVYQLSEIVGYGYPLEAVA